MQKNNKASKNKFKDLLSFEIGMGRHKRLFFDNLVLMISSNVNVVPALEGLLQEETSKSFKRVIEEMILEVKNGGSFWKSLKRHKIIASHYIPLIKLGEEAGKLAINFPAGFVQKK